MKRLWYLPLNSIENKISKQFLSDSTSRKHEWQICSSIDLSAYLPVSVKRS